MYNQPTTENVVEKEPENVLYKMSTTPFSIAKAEKKWYVLLGMSRLTEGFETEEEALRNAQEITWERILQLVGIAIEKYNEFNNLTNK